MNTLQYLGTFSREQNRPNFQLTTTVSATFTRVVLPQRFYLGNLNEVLGSGNATNIRQYFGLAFDSAGGADTCANQVRWKYIGNQGAISITPLSAIPVFPPGDLTTLDFFQYINYALFGVTASDVAHLPLTLQRGASIIDEYDNDTLTTGIYFSGGSPSGTPCDPDATCITFGADSR